MTQIFEPLKPSEVSAAIRDCIAADQPFCLHGDPGVSKSDLMMQEADIEFAERYKCNIGQDYTVTDATGRVLRPHERPWYYDFRTALHDSVDLTGVPQVVDGKTRFAAPELLMDLDPRGGLFAFDELNRGSDMTRNACLQLILTRAIGKTALPSTWRVGAAVNDKDTGISKMSAALTRRFTHLDVKADLDDTCKYAVRCNWEPVVIAFLRLFPALLNVFDPQHRVSPNPRAWDFVNRILARDKGTSQRVLQALISGNVGDDAAIQFIGFLRLFKSLPSLDAILLNPKTADVPTDPGVQYAISAALGRRATEKNFDRVLTYINRLPKEFSVFTVKDAVRRLPALQTMKGFVGWAVENGDVTWN